MDMEPKGDSDAKDAEAEEAKVKLEELINKALSNVDVSRRSQRSTNYFGRISKVY